jgi:site-specific DNA recombinase
MLEAHQADVLVVWRWSRVTRNRLDWALAVARVEAAGGRLESATEGFDTSTATGRFARGMLAEFAAFESDRMGDIRREVRDRRVRMGLPPFGHEQFGYRKVNGRYLVDPRTGPILASLYERYIAGESFRDLATWLRRRRVATAKPRSDQARFSHPVLRYVMDTGFGAGLIVSEGERFPGAHEPVITQETWHAYLARRAAVGHPRRVQPDTFLLNGLVTCTCGRPMTPQLQSVPPGRVFRCTDHRRGHGYRRISEARLQRLLYGWLLRLASDARQQTIVRRDSQRYAAAAALEVRRLARRCADPGSRDQLEAAQIASAWRDPVAVATTLVENWDTLTPELARQLLRQLLTTITVRTGDTIVSITVRTAWKTNSRLAESAAHASDYPPGWLDTNQAARLAGVTRCTIHRWRQAGLLPFTRSSQPRHYLYAASDLRRLISAPRHRGGVDHMAVQAAIAAANGSKPREVELQLG